MKFRTGQLVSRYEGMWEFDVPEGVGKFEYTQGNKVRLGGPLLLSPDGDLWSPCGLACAGHGAGSAVWGYQTIRCVLTRAL
jgi:hypothetical protein